MIEGWTRALIEGPSKQGLGVWGEGAGRNPKLCHMLSHFSVGYTCTLTVSLLFGFESGSGCKVSSPLIISGVGFGRVVRAKV